MKYLHLCFILVIIGFSLVDIECLPIENPETKIAVLLPGDIPADLPAGLDNDEKSVVTPSPVTLLNVEDADKPSGDATEEYRRSARGLGLGGFGDFGGLGNKFGGLGLGFKGFGGLGGWGLGGLHGLGGLGGLGGFKPFFGHHFG